MNVTGSPHRVKVAAISAHAPSAPSFAVRVLGPREDLGRLGIDIEPLTLFSDAEQEAFYTGSLTRKWHLAVTARRSLSRCLELLGPDTPCVLIQRRADILGSNRIERRAIASRRLVYDVDDAIWFDGPAANGSVFAFLKRSRTKAEWLAQRAEHVVAGNDYLAEHLSRFSRAVTVVPSLVDVSEYPARRHIDAETLTLGWIGSRTTASYLASVAAPLQLLARRLRPRQLRLLIVGGSPPPLGVDHEVLTWTPENQRLALERMDIGIMPQPAQPWVLGKCGYKALQYMASGIPVVADDIGVAATLIGEAGRAVDSPEEWIASLLTLANDAELRTALGAEGRRRAASEYSFERWLPTLADIFRGDS